MHKKTKYCCKEKSKIKVDKTNIVIILAVIIIIALGILALKKPNIVGFSIISKETAFSDNLNLVVNESKSVVWTLKNPGNLKSIRATGSIGRNGSAKIYAENGNKKLLIFDSTKQLFDVNVQVMPEYKKIFQGDELLIQITLFNLRGFGSINVNVRYSIKDPNENLIATEEEILAVETQAKFVRKLLIPPDLKPETYTAFVEVKTPDGLIGVSSDLFEVKAKYEKIYIPKIKYYVLALALIFALAAIIIFSMRLFKKLKKKKKVTKLKEKVPEEKIKKLEKELKALEAGYKSGFISKESYQKDKKRIEEKLGVSKK